VGHSNAINVIMISSSLRGMDSQTERYKYKYNIVDINDCVIILTLFYVCGILPHGFSSEFRNQDTVYWYRNYGRHNNYHNNQVTLETEQFPIGWTQLNK
jgi:hypothetical protein